MLFIKKKKISIDNVIREYVRNHPERFSCFNLDIELKTKEDRLIYELMKIPVIIEISRRPSKLGLGLEEQVYMSKCHEAPVIDKDGAAYCSKCGYETKVKTKVRISAYGAHVRASTPHNPLDWFRPFII
ncbi:hypothetical protein JW756_01725 [Candidatus Woesearchaeota archaeon]|nr:hypothetical protein [Candidatus Woesearchaeota archaeon]